MDHFNDDLLDTLPGPSRANIIWDNRYHVSEDVWDGSGREELDCICGNRAMRDWKLRRPQRELLHMMGFGIFTNPHVVLGNDARLISAMIERWRPETNTFFMRQGEMMVTLEDVGYILGLPVVGEAVTCGLIANRKEFFVRNWFEPLTDEEVDDALFRNHIKLTWLFERYGRQKPEKHNAEATIVHTQAYLVFLCGAVLFPTKDRAYAHVRYIVPLSNIREIHNYAWGAAVLAHTYRGLEIAARRSSKSVAACVWLLHIWSYERFPRIGVPQRDPDQDDYPVAES